MRYGSHSIYTAILFTFKGLYIIAMKKIIIILFLFVLAPTLTDCKKKKTIEEEPIDSSFDKSGMLNNYSSNVVIPNFQIAKNALDSLALAYTNFVAGKTTANLLIVRQKFISAYVAYQHIETFEFGPSEIEIVRANFNTFPTDSSQIKSNINSGTYDLSTVSNLDAKGFPAIDYLLYSKGLTDTQVVDLFINSSNRIIYLSNCLSEMQSKINTILSTWNNSYNSAFKNSTGSEIGSSLGMLVNQLNFELDLLKNAKVGIPLGKKTLGVILPEQCEAYYANTISVKLVSECLLNLENVYLGRSQSGNDGLGLDDYLEALKSQHTSGTLNNAIKNQFNIAKTKVAAIPEPLSSTIQTNPAVVDAAYTELVKLLVLLKTDMPSAMGIVITYQDGDGD